VSGYLSPPGFAGNLGGLPIVASPIVPPDTAYLAGGRLFTRDPAHFVYRLQMSAIKAAMREDLERILDAFATRWGLSR
jgi:hypothetical protein